MSSRFPAAKLDGRRQMRPSCALPPTTFTGGAISDDRRDVRPHGPDDHDGHQEPWEQQKQRHDHSVHADHFTSHLPSGTSPGAFPGPNGSVFAPYSPQHNRRTRQMRCHASKYAGQRAPGPHPWSLTHRNPCQNRHGACGPGATVPAAARDDLDAFASRSCEQEDSPLAPVPGRAPGSQGLRSRYRDTRPSRRFFRVLGETGTAPPFVRRG